MAKDLIYRDEAATLISDEVEAQLPAALGDAVGSPDQVAAAGDLGRVALWDTGRGSGTVTESQNAVAYTSVGATWERSANGLIIDSSTNSTLVADVGQTSVEVEVSVYRSSASTSQHRVYVAYDDEDNWLAVRVRNAGDLSELSVVKMVDGVQTPINTVTLDASLNGRWLRMKVVCSDNPAVGELALEAQVGVQVHTEKITGADYTELTLGTSAGIGLQSSSSFWRAADLVVRT